MGRKIGILFDLDGTLLDTLQDLTDAVNHTLAQLGYALLTDREVRACVGNGARELMRLAIGADANDPGVDAALAVFQPYYEANCRIKTKPYEGVVQALSRLQETCPVGIVSNKPDYAVKPLCAALFPGVYAIGEQTGCPRKPAPDMLYRAMGDLKVEQCLYVGDSEVDITTAKNAGLPCVSVLWGFRDRQQLQTAGGTHFCEKPCELVRTVETVIKESIQ